MLPAGWHTMSVEELRRLCVEAFPSSATRHQIMEGLEQVVRRLIAAGVSGELWVDGSFVTRKTNPEDSDVVLRIDAAAYDSGSSEVREAIEWVADGLRDDLFCDSHPLFVYPEDHPYYAKGERKVAYWKREWGLSRRKEAKGIVVVKLAQGRK